MAKLNGTEKQIAWANDIKKALLDGYSVVQQNGVVVEFRQDCVNGHIERIENELKHYEEKTLRKGPSELRTKLMNESKVSEPVREYIG